MLLFVIHFNNTGNKCQESCSPRPVEIVVTQPPALPILMEPRLIHRACRDASGMSGWNGEGLLVDEEILGGRSKERRASGKGTWGAEGPT